MCIHALEHAWDSSPLRGFALLREASKVQGTFGFVRLVVSARTSVHGAVRSLAAGEHGCSGQL
jgi:hypothetical protein